MSIYLISGNFNLPKIKWLKSPLYPTELSKFETYFFCTLTDQVRLIYSPTRDHNILDLLIVNIPEKFTYIQVTDPPSMASSHHGAFRVHRKSTFCRKINRTV